MIANIDELKSEVLRRVIVKEEDLIGCSDRGLESIEPSHPDIAADRDLDRSKKEASKQN